MASATSSSAERLRLVARVARTSAPPVAILGAALLSTWLYTGAEGWPFAAAFLAGAAASAVLSALRQAPDLRRLDEVEDVAAALGAGELGSRMSLRDDEFAGLSNAINAAAARLEERIGALAREAAQLQALLNASGDASIAVDADGTIAYVNDAARSMFGPGVAAGRPFIEVVRDHDLNDVVIAAARHGERSVRVVPYGQQQRWLQATAVPITNGGGWAALAVFHDLTELRRLDSVRRDFISNVSHELRTPLAGIRAAAETLQGGALEDHVAAREFVGHIERETDRLTQMVEELLELSRIESGAAPMVFRQLDACDLVSEAVRRFSQQAERAGLTLKAERGDLPLLIYGDADRLERALGNLFANAIRFTPAGGTVAARAGAAGDAIAISVEDTGVGIEPEQQRRVFERFYKADPARGESGVGLGLAIVKHIVLAHEGSVEVESRPGRGSKFTMYLPRR